MQSKFEGRNFVLKSYFRTVVHDLEYVHGTAYDTFIDEKVSLDLWPEIDVEFRRLIRALSRIADKKEGVIL